MRKIQDLHVLATQPLVAPRALKEELPVDEMLAETVVNARETVRRILNGHDNRLLCVGRPSPDHYPGEAARFAGRFRQLYPELAERAFIVMRVYFEKPRTTV